MSSSLPRITARVDSATRSILSQAAAIIGISSLNSFVLNAAIEKAKKIIEQENLLKLSDRDAVALIHALDMEAKPNLRLQAAGKLYAAKR